MKKLIAGLLIALAASSADAAPGKLTFSGITDPSIYLGGYPAASVVAPTFEGYFLFDDAASIYSSTVNGSATTSLYKAVTYFTIKSGGYQITLDSSMPYLYENDVIVTNSTSLAQNDGIRFQIESGTLYGSFDL